MSGFGRQKCKCHVLRKGALSSYFLDTTLVLGNASSRQYLWEEGRGFNLVS